jgi:hypothetical protein
MARRFDDEAHGFGSGAGTTRAGTPMMAKVVSIRIASMVTVTKPVF